MEDTDFAVAVFATSSAGFVLAATFLNFLQSAIQIIGIGTAISLGLTIYKVHLDRKETIRRKRLEGVQRLQPKVYDPMLAWSVQSNNRLSNLVPNEIRNPLSPPPELTPVGDYIAIVGNMLKTTLETTLRLYQSYVNLQQTIQEEYYKRIGSTFAEYGYADDAYSSSIVFDGSAIQIGIIPNNYDLEHITKRIRQSKTIHFNVLNPKSGIREDVPSREEFITIIASPQGLPSFQQFETTKTKLIQQFNTLIALLTHIIVNGEKDWKL